VPTPSEDPDQRLVDRARRELPYRTAAYQELVGRHSAAVFRRAHRLLGSRADAEDVVQEVFLNVFRALPRTEVRGSFVHWLNAITLNASLRLLDRRRRERRRREAFQSDQTAAAPQPESDPMLRRSLIEALDLLSPQTRVAILLRFVDGHSYVEIARMTGEKESTLKMRVARGMQRVRVQLGLDREGSEQK
jgi:RNA polymerase sigma-70 factor (ECF subfamily)